MTVDDEEGNVQTTTEDSQSVIDASDGTPSESGVTKEDTETQEQTSEHEKASLQMSKDAISLQKELAAIRVVAPDISVPPDTDFNKDEFPESYRENSAKEKLALAYADNFRRQYVHLYRDRKPLLLNPVNECGTEKFVCTTIRPTQLPFKEMFDWDGAAEFVADYLNFVSLDPPHDLPNRLLSPTTVLERQKGNCFEYSTLLCSLLIAAGYDCYVVSGYATRETCMMDETRDLCPLLKKSDKVRQKSASFENKKYAVKPPKDLSSKFIRKQENRKEKELEDNEQKEVDEEQARQLEREKPPSDPLYGLRVHSWVLVLAGKREVPESFFIEPFTGFAHPVNSGNYLGIESLWNYQNYWVNMQDCSEGVTQMLYDLGDCTIWEYMFPSNEKPILEIPDVDHMFEDEEEEEEVEKHLDVPPSWVRQIELTLKNFQLRCPVGKKTKIYKRAKLEKFAHYLVKDGLVTRLSMYQDAEMSILTQVKEFFAHRIDKLIERHHNHINGWITEYYIPSRRCHLKEHEYKASAPGIENDRTMIFFNEARVDGLVKRTETPLSMTEYFINRPDFLHYRHVEFGKREKKFGPAESAIPRPIEKMVERFHRNHEKNANDNVAECVFIVSEERIQLMYHKEDNKISASTQEFMKPANANEKGAYILWHADTHTTYQVDPKNYEKKTVILYQMLVDLIQKEEKCKERVRESEQEVQMILSDRTREEINSELLISVYDTERNEKAKQRRKELELEETQERLRRQEMELDYLAPFLAQLGDPEKITRNQAFKLKEDCLADLKHRLIDKANLIQARFEKETQELQKKQSWYQQHQISMQKDDEDEYLNYCSEAMFRIHILELRLNRHKEMAPQKYMELEQRIRNDSRLSEYF